MELQSSEEFSNLGKKVDEILVTTNFESNGIKNAKDANNSKESVLKTGALSAIAMEYNSSDSESEEIEFQGSQAEIINETENLKVTEAEKVSGITKVTKVAQAGGVTEIVEVTELETEVGTEASEAEVLKEYRSHVEIVCSSDEVDSEEDSSSSDDSTGSSKNESSAESTEDEEETNKVTKADKIQKGRQRCRKESKGEFDDLPPIEELNINVPEVLCDPLGEVAWIVDQMVVVHPKPGKPTLNLDTVLFVERGRRVLGRIFDVFGKVSDPHYCVRFNNSQHIQESNIKVGMNVYFCPNTEYTSVVFLHELSKMKASDPTDDDEPPQFSDDEEEQAYYQNLKKQQKIEKADSESGIPTKKKRNSGPKSTGGKQNAGTKTDWKSQHPWNTKRQVQNQYRPTEHRQQVSNSTIPNPSQNWYRPGYQQNYWPPFQAFPNPAWPMFHPRNYSGSNNFRPHMGIPLHFPPHRFSNPVSWNVRNQTPLPHNIQTDNSSAESVIAINPLLPPPPPPTTSSSSTTYLSPPGS